MKRIKLIAAVIAAVSAVCFCGVFTLQKQTNDQMPVITFETPETELTCEEWKQSSLDGVSAYDKEDGDLTAAVKITDQSMFTEDGVFLASYMVADSSGNISSASRTVRLTDYKPPRMLLKTAPVVYVGSQEPVQNIMRVDDMLDGTLSSHSYLLLSNTVNVGISGEYQVELEAVNSYGDSVSETIPVWVVPNEGGPSISLKQYMVYVEKGGRFDARSYIKSVKSTEGMRLARSGVMIDDSALNLQECGTYLVKYTCLDKKKTGYSAIAVVVTEKGQ